MQITVKVNVSDKCIACRFYHYKSDICLIFKETIYDSIPCKECLKAQLATEYKRGQNGKDNL